MRVARPAGEQAGQRPDVNHLRALAALVVDLLVGTGREKTGKGVDDRQYTTPCHSGSGRDHVLFSDAALNESLRKSPGKAEEAAVLHQVGIQGHQVWMLLRLRDERAFVRRKAVVGLA